MDTLPGGDYRIGQPDPAHDEGALAQLLDAYRQFYDEPSDLAAAQAFVRERFRLADTRFFVARATGDELLGFAHLLPSLDTLTLRRIGIVEDIFVADSSRNRGIGGALLEAAAEYARESGFSRLTLATAHKNRTAQRLYLSHGYVPDQRFRSFNLALDAGTAGLADGSAATPQ